MNNKRLQSSVKINFIKILKSDGQSFIELIKKNSKLNSIINQKYKILSEHHFLLFPLIVL